ncbi:hypothetical protein B0A52_07996 [Exophiala mesophila]|uniref:Phosphate transporter n=1 Tax=Exophiala mesophila TaxID=212818 RepID=A0A438MXU2_EXOME|nr:hypothetical protein B0A52_07996 [Exophiala mesophila]
MPSPQTAPYDWILAITSIAFIFSAFGNGANDVANSYATSVAARTLTMPQVGFLSMITEFVGAGSPGPLMLAMGCAEVGSATWLMLATTWGWPVSTTQTVVGALIGTGFASQASVKWAWESGSVSQVAASWFIAPLIAAAISALIFGTVKYSVVERKDPFKWAMRLIPYYFATTASILALFIVVEVPTAPSLEEFGAGKAVGIILGVWFGVLAICYIFFMPYFERRLIKKDSRVKFYHAPLGPLLRRENPPLYFPAKEDGKYVTDYYENAYATAEAAVSEDLKVETSSSSSTTPDIVNLEKGKLAEPPRPRGPIGPVERFLDPVRSLPWTSSKKWLGYGKFALLQGVTRDCVSHDSARLRDVHSRAAKYDLRVEHLWTYCQVASAMLMSIAHGSNDVANAVGPWVAVYQTYIDGEVSTTSPTPVWILVIAGFLLGAGFWVYGYNIVRALGNKITQMSPTRGFSVELGAAVTVLLASRLALPVSTTQCLTGATMGVALMNYDFGAVNWRQLGFIFIGWMLTLPSAGLIAGLLCLMALNTPHF